MRSVESEKLRKLLTVEQPTTDEEWKAHTFLFNVADARENGYEAVCAECGTGIGLLNDQDEQWHEDWCQMEATTAAAEAAFAERVRGIIGGE